jgi:hypothetical protein
MKKLILFLPLLCMAADGPPAYPENYREWVWLSSGLGMTYGPAATGMLMFDNVFVTPEAYRAFQKAGTWPDKTMFVLELRGAESKGSINKDGHFQGGLHGIEVEVKNGGKWTFYGFPNGTKTGRELPSTAGCYSCHSQKGAVDNTFVQFYPTLIEVAKQKGTFKETE